MNALSRYEQYVLEEGEKSVEITEDTKIPNAATFKIIKQDHTLANMLRAELLTAPTTLFAGYLVPHPLQPHFLLKIQTDGTITPLDALNQCTQSLMKKIVILESKFKREFAYKGADAAAGGADASGGIGVDAYGTTGVGLGGSNDAGVWSSKDYLDF